MTINANTDANSDEKPPRIKARHLVEYAAARCAIFLLDRLPLAAARALGRLLGRLAWKVVRVRRRQTLENLNRSFPDLSAGRLHEIGRRCYCNLGAYFIECFRIHRLSDRELAELVTFERREVLDQALAQGRGVVNVTFHYGNWELMGARAAREGWPLEVIARSQTNPLFDAYVNRLRQANGMRLVNVRAPSREIFRLLRAGRIVTFLADQDAHRVGVFVDFLGRPASTPVGPALFAFKAGSPLVLSIMVPGGADRWKVVFEPVPRPQTSDRAGFVREVTAYYTARLEEYVRRAPEYWFWPHRRWKTRPED
ncbi:MAG TPA: lysophospholipid acyltransferase family protein [Candidatus Glassbacteria bacterium]|nr:lysophospholipid acyltransferase family protein [Candidatus Glassbacteria bacterium]